MRPILFLAPLAAALVLSLNVASHAASDAPPPPKKCQAGMVFDTAKGKCVKKGAQFHGDDELLRRGWALAEAKKFDAAIRVFSSLSRADHPKALNGLGYSHRMKGDLDTGIRYYKAALAIDPGYLQARNYLAKGYLTLGLLDRARAELGEIGKRCGKTCELHADLAAAIRKAEKGLRVSY